MPVPRFALFTVALLGGCVALRHNELASAPKPVWLFELRAEPAEFVLSGRRGVKVVYSLLNSSPHAQQLDFPTAQRFEVNLRDSGGRNLFQWSEDRSFAQLASSVVVNPGERLVYEAELPTRDMVAGRRFAVDAILPGYPETAASTELFPR